MPPRHDDTLPGTAALRRVCHAHGVDPTDARLLHHRSNAVYLVPHAQVIARLAPDTPLRRQRADTSVAVTRWLGTQPDPIALPPRPGPNPVITAGAVATFWPYRPTPGPATPSDLAAPLRALHRLPTPPFPIPTYRPLHRLREALHLDHTRPRPALAAADRAWLHDRADTLVAAYDTTHFPLGVGVIHGDAHTENLVTDEDRHLLIDWDSTCLGPRELDLTSAIPDHFHTPEHHRRGFLTAYGHDLLAGNNWTLLRDITELHAIAAYIRLAPTKPTAATELHRRVRSLRTPDRSVVWRAVG